MVLVFIIIIWTLSGSSAFGDVAGRIGVIDADTLDVGDVRVRLFGIDAPEKKQTCERANGQIWRCGLWATQQVEHRYDGAWAVCDEVDRDRYGRVVARCFVGGVDIGKQLVDDGIATAYLKYSNAYWNDEVIAKGKRLGLHGSRFETPASFRKQGGTPPTDPNCAIKGNISSKNRRIAHLPGQVDYARTRISMAKGERWFCSIGQARAAGWRLAKR